MSSKLVLFTLISSALAVPFAALHPRYPAGNATTIMPTGGEHTTIQSTTVLTNTKVITEVLTMVRPTSAVQSGAGGQGEQTVGAEATGGAGNGGQGGQGGNGGQQCGGVVTSTIKQQVTVTVTAGSQNTPAPAPPAVSSHVESPVAPSFATFNSAPSAPAPAPESHTPAPAPVAPSSNLAPAPAPSSSAVQVEQPKPSSTTEETPAPTPSQETNTGNGKRGIAYNDASMAGIFASNDKLSWAFNWEATSKGLSSGFEYVPMMWGLKSDFTSTWKGFADEAIAAGSKHLMAFNEPDHQDQANMSPAEAAKQYRTYFQQYYNKGVKLGAPSVTNGGGDMGLNWLTSFMKECSDCQIDFCPVHWYDSPDNVEYFKSHMAEATKACNGKPIWVTEFGTNDGSDDQVTTFLKTVMPWMDGQDYIERYAYFMAKDGARMLLSGTAESVIGKAYCSI